jgi:hypothetical protein
MESPVTLHAKRKAEQLVTNLVESNLDHAARPAPRASGEAEFRQ